MCRRSSGCFLRIFPHGGWHGEQEVVASLCFILVSISDGIDGYLARSRGQITTMGMLLDPIADKLLITSAYVALVEFNPHVVKPWIVVVVIGREFLVSGLRSIASTEGFTIEASDIGKLKTVIQIVSVVAVILDHGWYQWQMGWFVIPVHLFAVVGIYYMAGSRFSRPSIISGPSGARSRRQPRPGAAAIMNMC